MKKNIINKLILLSTLLFGLVGCGKTPPIESSVEDPTSHVSEGTTSEETPSEEPGDVFGEDFLVRPELPLLVRKLEDDEAYRVSKSLAENITSVVDVKTMQRGLGLGSYIDRIYESTYKAHTLIYTNASHFITRDFKETYKYIGGSITFPSEEFRQTDEFFWKDGVTYNVYTHDPKDGKGVDYRFGYDLVEEEEINPYIIPIIETGVGHTFFYDAYIDIEGNYHFLDELYTYQIEPEDGLFRHNFHYFYADYKVNANFECESSYIEEINRTSLFEDGNQREIEELDLTNHYQSRSLLSYGELVTTPNLDQKIASFPEVVFTGDTKLVVGEHDTYMDGDTIVIDEEATMTYISDLDIRRNSEAVASGEIDITGSLDLDKALLISVGYNALKFNIPEDPFILYWRDSFKLIGNFDEQFFSLLKIVKQGENYYLVYHPDNPLEAPPSIELAISFTFTMTPTLVEDEPRGVLELANLVIEILEE
jgi:hypothetical protein